MKFEVGDKVMLTGRSWAVMDGLIRVGEPPLHNSTQVIAGFDQQVGATASAPYFPAPPGSGRFFIYTSTSEYSDTDFSATLLYPPIERNKNKMSPTKKSKKYILPDGREYITRRVGGFDNDVEAMQGLRSMKKHVLLLGEPGCGKTALIQCAFPDSENEIGHDKLTAFDMLWRPRPLPDGTIQFDPSPLHRAVTQGKVFYFDEIMRSNADALTPLFSAMDGRGFVVGGNLDGTDLPVKDGFMVVGASNPLVRGAFLPDAIASRFHILEVQTSEELLLQLGLNEMLLVAWKNLNAQDGGESWKPSIRELLSAQSFIDAGNMPQAAYALTGYRVPARDREMVAGAIGPLLGVRVGKDGGLIR